MRCFLVVLTISSMMASSGGCAAIGACPEGEMLVDGDCIRVDDGTPAAQSKELDLACSISPDIDNRLEPPFVVYELTVKPLEPIVAGERFGAAFEGRASFSEGFLNTGQRLVPGGFKRGAFLELQATVHVRGGATGPDVTLKPAPIQTTCTYDDNGNRGPEAGPFPECSQENDNEDGSNDECIGLGEMPRPENRCLTYYDVPTSDDCTPGGVCDELGQTGADSPCDLNGFCASEPLARPIHGSDNGYLADSSGNVLFGWADESAGGTIQEGGPNDGTWILPPAVIAEPAGPNGIRSIIEGLAFAFECVMGVQSAGEDGANSRDPLSSPTPDELLIAFPIQQR